jgi:acyl carrier protein
MRDGRSLMNSKFEERIIALLAQERGIPPGRIKPTSRLLEDLGMDGDDARDFFEMYRTEFEVDVTNMKWDRKLPLL